MEENIKHQGFGIRTKTDDINIVNKWDQVGNKEGKRPTGSMRQYYVQLELLFAPFLRYTRSM